MPKERSEESSGKKFWSSKRIITIFILAFVFIFGIMFAHYYIEPMLGQDCMNDLRICKAQVRVLDEENRACYQQNHDLNMLLKACEYDLRRYQETG